MTTNPYTGMLLRFNENRVYGWANEIIAILQVITDLYPRSHAIYGSRTIGKSTLLRYIMAGAQRDYEAFLSVAYRPGGGARLLFVYFTSHHYKQEENLFLLMYVELGEKLRDEDYDTPMPYVDEQTSKPHIVEALQEVFDTLDQQGVRVVFVLDDFDTPLEYIKTVDDNLLRVLSDDVSMILATEDPIFKTRPDIAEHSPFLGILRPEVIGLIDEDAARQLICEPARLDASTELEANEATFLIDLAGCRPFLLISTCEHYFGLRQRFPQLPKTIKDAASRDRLKRQLIEQLIALPHMNNVLSNMWNECTELEREALVEMSAGGGTSRLDISGGVGQTLSNKALAYFDALTGTYRVFSQMFAAYVRQQGEPQTRRVGVQQRPKSKETAVQMEDLTPIDRSLFEYFLQHINDTLTFDQLMQEIWGDNDNKKRALEAAVHRLRSKIGEHEEIRNVRGVGYRYTQRTVRDLA